MENIEETKKRGRPKANGEKERQDAFNSEKLDIVNKSANDEINDSLNETPPIDDQKTSPVEDQKSPPVELIDGEKMVKVYYILGSNRGRTMYIPRGTYLKDLKRGILVLIK